MTPDPSELISRCLAVNAAFVIVTVTETAGSTPREPGATLAVAADSVAGTIGGGRLEWEAIEAARCMLDKASKNRTMSVTLGPDSGQCCGGRVTLRLECGTRGHLAALQKRQQEQLAMRSRVFIHGAGHVGRALAAALAPLPFKVVLADSRVEELDLARDVKVERVLTQTPVALAEAAPAGSAHVVLTHSHALDSLIAAAVLEANTARYLGIIGSKTKKALFRKAFRAVGIPEARIKRVVCPIGGHAVKDKRPEVIAALVAAEITTALLACVNGQQRKNGG